ncbi:MAG: hypothetical protein F6K48_03745 [Okeania sp. SIO3H1]|nr:hypothetical protein [Okeania sp. SIO3H1]
MYREGKEDRSWKKEEVGANGRSPLQCKEKPYMALDISPTLYTNAPQRT